MRHVHGGAFIAYVEDANALSCHVVPDRLDVAALQAEDAIDPAGEQKAGNQFGDGATGLGVHRHSFDARAGELKTVEGRAGRVIGCSRIRGRAYSIGR
jgi:hypothetical protein